MEEIIKSYMGLAILMLTLTLGLNMIKVNLDVRNANVQMENYVRRIEASNSDDTVIMACKADAANRGYNFDYKPIVVSEDSKYGTAELEYDFSLGLMGIKKQKTITRDIN